MPHLVFLGILAIAVIGFIVIKVLKNQEIQEVEEDDDEGIRKPIGKEPENFDTKDYVKQYVGRSK